MSTANKQDKQYHSVFSDSTKLATKSACAFPKTNGAKTVETPLKKGGQPKKGT